MKSKLPEFIAYKGYNIPTGKTESDKNQRRQIINNFYNDWSGENDEKRVKNNELKHFIHVNQLSKKHTARYACNDFQSTLTVLELSYVLRYAVKVGSDKPKNNKSQEGFIDMLIMECVVPCLRPYVTTAKLIVGVIRCRGRKLQYCLTAKKRSLS
jgi:hypothetical protein